MTESEGIYSFIAFLIVLIIALSVIVIEVAVVVSALRILGVQI